MRRRMAFVLSIVKGIAMNIGINAIAFALISATGLPGHAQAPSSPSALAASAQTSPANAISPHERFEASLKALTENDYYRAAAEMRRGEALVEREAAGAASEARAALEASAAELELLASEVETGAMRDLQRLESAFARAEHALALAHRARMPDGEQASPFDYGA
jgi:hypothetical protein